MPNVNPGKLLLELEAAGIDIGGCNSDGVVWDTDGLTEIQGQPNVAAIIAAHDPTDYAAVRQAAARDELKQAAALRNVTPSQAVTYIENNVVDLASAKAVLKLLARMVIAMRDQMWPDIPDDPTA